MSSERDPGSADPRPAPGEADPAGLPAEPAEAEEVPAAESPAAVEAHERPDSHNMLPPRERRRTRAERLLVRLIATGGIVGIGVAISAIMVANGSQGWLVGLVVSIVSVVLAAILWSSRQL